MNEMLFNFLSWINSWVGSWGWAMVIFTVLIRLVLTPLDIKSRVGMRKTAAILTVEGNRIRSEDVVLGF